MTKFKSFFKLLGIGLLSFFIPGKAKPSAPSTIENRIEVVRKVIKNKLENGNKSEINIDFTNYTLDNEWINWGNWGNWNNWRDWNNWKDWHNWNDFSNWQKFSNY